MLFDNDHQPHPLFIWCFAATPLRQVFVWIRIWNKEWLELIVTIYLTLRF